MVDLIRFVDAISATPGVRLNLNDDVAWSVHNDSTFTPPAIKRSVTASMLRDGDFVGATAYGNRELGLVLTVKATPADAAAVEVQKLARELDRKTNLLEWRPDGAGA